jgi:hypothetical protein
MANIFAVKLVQMGIPIGKHADTKVVIAAKSTHLGFD